MVGHYSYPVVGQGIAEVEEKIDRVGSGLGLEIGFGKEDQRRES